jgi:hypothetical protein
MPAAAAELNGQTARLFMVLIFTGKSPCAICGAILKEGEDIFAKSAGPIQSNDSLWRYQDSGAHRDWFRKRPRRYSFGQKFNEYFDHHLRGMRFIREDGTMEEREPRAGCSV